MTVRIFLISLLCLCHAKEISETIISCFPQSIDDDKKDDHSHDLLGKILQHIEKDARPRISSVYHLATMITGFCVSFVEDCHDALGHGPKESFLQMFASSIGDVVSSIPYSGI
jgi:hypothetical protein